MTLCPIGANCSNYLLSVRFDRYVLLMTTTAVAPRSRRTASREADARVGERAHMLIWASGRTQGAVAEAIGIEPTAFGKKLRGRNGWAIQELIDMAAELNTSVGYLVGETGTPPVGPAGIEPTTSTVESRELAPVTRLRPRAFGNAIRPAGTAA